MTESFLLAVNRVTTLNEVSGLHCGTSEAPVVAALSPALKRVAYLSWILPGIHSARLDVGEPDPAQDERLGLNCAWYADVLRLLTEPQAVAEELLEVPQPS